MCEQCPDLIQWIEKMWQNGEKKEKEIDFICLLYDISPETENTKFQTKTNQMQTLNNDKLHTQNAIRSNANWCQTMDYKCQTSVRIICLWIK